MIRIISKLIILIVLILLILITFKEIVKQLNESDTASTEETETIQIKETEETETIQTEEIKETKEIEFIDKEELVDTVNTEGPYTIKIYRNDNVVEIYSMNKPIKTMLCSVGTGEEDNETPLGTFKIYERYRWRQLFGNVFGQYAVRFNGHILFHSVPYINQDESTLKPGEYNKLGEPASLGCVRLSVADAKWIHDNCEDGTVVEVLESKETSDLVKPLGIKVEDTSEFVGWDPTDPDENNPWLGKLPKIKNVKDIVIVKGSNLEILKTVLNEVNGIDFDGSSIEVFIDNIESINLNECGTYEIIYKTTGVYGATVFSRASVNVVEEIK